MTNACTNPTTLPTSNRPRILVGVTGSVAAIVSPEIVVRLYKDLNADVRVLLTSGGQNFWDKAKDFDLKQWELFQELLPNIPVYGPEVEWDGWNRLGDPVLHVDLRDWADVLVIAPLSAHTLAKIANGLCDDTLSCVARAWDMGYGPRPAKPIVLAPAMNTAMWQHPATAEQLTKLTNMSNRTVVVEPVAKELACGEIGMGALADVDTIVDRVQQCLQ